MKRLLIGAGIICMLIVVWIYFAARKPSPASINNTNVQGTYLEGIVTNENGKPISGVQFHIISGGFGSGRSDRKGRFRIHWQYQPFQSEEESFLIAKHRKKNLGAVEKLE